MIPETPIGAGPAGRRTAQRQFSQRVGGHTDSTESGRPDITGGDSIIASIHHTLRFLAATLRAKAVVEVGTGSGESALWLLRGMVADGVLTSIDADPDTQRAARAALSKAGVAAGRTRMITGAALQVLSRLTESAYDLVLVNAVRSQYTKYLELGLRLLRPGGAIVFTGVQFRETRDGDPRDAQGLALRELTQAIQDDDSLVPVVLPVGAGLLAVART